MKTKVLHLIHGMTMGGAETLVKDYFLLIDKEKFDVVLLCMTRHGTAYEKLLEESGIRIIYVSDLIERYVKRNCGVFGKVFRRFALYYYVKKIIRAEKPDVIHTHLTVNRYIAYAHPPKDTKIFYTVHSEPKVIWAKTLMRQMEYRALCQLSRNYDLHFIALHDGMRREINEMFHVSNTLVLNNGIDFSRFENVQDKQLVRKKESIPEDAFVVGHVGRFTASKNHKFLVDVFAEISKQQENAFLLLVGDGKTKNEIEDQINSLGLQNKCKILSNRTDIPDLMNAMDAFVFPSIFEGLGIVLIEAQKMKLPCTVSDTVPKAAEVSNLVQWMSLQQNAETWARAIMKFQVENPAYYGIEKWDMNQVVRELEKIYILKE